MLTIEKIRANFPILKRKVKGQPLIYLDNAATTLKPASVIEAVSYHYQNESANIHRGAHTLSEEATSKYEATRENVARFIGANSSKEIIFTSGTTDSINLIVQTYARSNLQKGDEVLLTHLEHHSNIVPWQMLRSQIDLHAESSRHQPQGRTRSRRL